MSTDESAVAPSPAEKNKWNWSLLFVVAVLAITAGIGLFVYFWHAASPFDAPKQGEIFLSGNEKQLEPTKSDTPIDHLQVDVSMKENGKPELTFQLPSNGTRGVPRFFLEQDEKSKSWKLVFVPPVVKKSHENEVTGLRSAWIRQLGANEQVQAGLDDKKFGSRLEISLPVGVVKVNRSDSLKKDAFEAKRKEVPAFAKAFASLLAADQSAAKRDLVGMLKTAGYDGNAHRIEILKAENIVNQLGTLADKDGELLSLKLLENADSQVSSLPPFYFSATGLKWIGSLSYKPSQDKSVTINVSIRNIPSKYEFKSFCLIDEARNIDRITRFQVESAKVFASDNIASDWPARAWLLPGDKASLNPMFLIPILQSCRHHYFPLDGKPSEIDKLSEKLIASINKANISAIKVRLREIQENTAHGYHPTYLFCEYVVALIHLRSLAHKAPGAKTKDLDMAGLDDLILDSAVVIAGNVTPDGRFKRYLYDSNKDEWDRSVGQVGLYALQYVLLAFPDAKSQNDQSGRLGVVREKLTALADHYKKHTGDIPYSGDSGSNPNLRPAYFQAVIALAQLDKITPDEFRGALQRLENHFKSTSYGSEIKGYQDAYRWLYWARVYELMVRLQNDPERRFDTLFANQKRPTPALYDALQLMSSTLGGVVGDYLKMESQITFGNAGDFSCTRNTMLAIAMESIWQSVEVQAEQRHK